MTERQLERLQKFGITQAYDCEDEYELDCTVHGCSSLAYGGTYYEQANAQVLVDEFDEVKGFYQRCGYPSVYVCSFNVNELSEEDAERLIALLEDASMWCGYPVLNEELAWHFEYLDTMSALEEELSWFLESNNLRLKDDIERGVVIDYMFTEANADGCLYEIEQGPSVYVRSEVFAERMPEEFYEPDEDVEAV